MKIPKGLSSEARKLWTTTAATWALDEPAYVLLTNACHCLDRLRVAEKAVRDAGQTFTDRFGQIKPHPSLATIRDENTTLVRILKQLGLDVAGAAEKTRFYEDQ
jgi:phage terminase small subunit